jgi:iron complex outermembrane receptor protein
MKVALCCGGSVFAVALGLCGSQAYAATATAEATTPGVVGELTVIAEKREENIERVPVAVSAFSAEQRKLIGIAIIQDLADFSPSLNWTDITDRVYIRGIGRNSDNLNNTSGVAIYYNGIYYGANAAIEQQKSDLFIGNIEVDNGPQNTLHGSNADGGVLSFTSKHPTDHLYGEVRTGIANYETYFVESVISGPINDHLKFRLGGNFTEQRGGFFKNLIGSPQGGNLVLGGSGETHYLEGQLEGHWDKLDAWIQASSGNFIANTHGAALVGYFPTTHDTPQDTLTPSGFYGLCGLPGVIGSSNGLGCAGGPPIVPGSVVTRAITANQFPGNNPGNIDPRTFINEDNGINDMDGDIQISTHVTYHLPDLDINYLGGYQNFHYTLHIPNQPVAGVDSGVVSWQEAGVTGAGAGFCTAVLGFTAAACAAPLKVNSTPNFLVFDEFDQAFSHELNFTSTGSSPLQYIGGLYWYRERWHQPVYADSMSAQPQMGTPVQTPILGGTCPAGAEVCAAPANPTFAGSSENTAITYDSIAIYGQFSYKFNDDWKFTGALRYTNDHKEGWQTWRVVSFDTILTSTLLGGATPAFDITALAACTQAPPLPCEPAFQGAGITTLNPVTGNADRALGATWNALTGEANIDWTPDATTLAYFKYSRGYKSGGWSTYTIGPQPYVGSEFVDAFELGAKKTIGREWTLNGDIFYYNYNGEQVPLSVLNPATNQIVPILYNLPVVHNYGVELWGTWRPTDDLAVSLSYSYLSAKIIQSNCVLDTTDPQAIQAGANPHGCGAGAPAGVQNIVGQTVPGATPNKVSLNGLYTWHFDPGNLTLSGTFIFRDGTYDDVFNRWYSFQPASTQVNVRATWSGKDDRYNIILFCNNLFDTTANDGAGGTLLFNAPGFENIAKAPFLNAPRTFGLQLQVRWQ